MVICSLLCSQNVAGRNWFLAAKSHHEAQNLPMQCNAMLYCNAMQCNPMVEKHLSQIFLRHKVLVGWTLTELCVLVLSLGLNNYNYTKKTIADVSLHSPIFFAQNDLNVFWACGRDHLWAPTIKYTTWNVSGLATTEDEEAQERRGMNGGDNDHHNK